MSDCSFEVSDAIGVFTFNRPEVLNVITLEMYADLRDRMASLQTDDSVKVVVLTGAGLQFLFTHVDLTGGDKGAAYLLPRIVGAGRAYEFLALGITKRLLVDE